MRYKKMEKLKLTGGTMKSYNFKKLENCIVKLIFPLFLLLYPFRHVHWGVDLWDTGYNYANFLYMGTEHMDPMWLFSTYLSNVTGWLLAKLPFGHTLIGMNVYTGLFVGGLALTGYWFCIKKLGISPWLTFLGEVVAVCLCWCPTALLYNYLSTLLLLLLDHIHILYDILYYK